MVSFSHTEKQQFDRFYRQFLQVQNDLDYPGHEYLRREYFQQALYNNLFAENAIKHAPSPGYQLRVLKELMRRVEASIQDWEEEAISDDLMSCLCTLVASNIPAAATAAQQKSYVTYTVTSLSSSPVIAPSITLLEAHSLVVAAGTTGLRTWEASLLLGNYLCGHPDLVKENAVLELGAGTGYVSILCAKVLGAKHVLATDGSDDVVAELPTNFYLNGLQDSSRIEAKELKWGHVSMGGEQPEWNGGRKFDIVLGADVTYDANTFIALTATFGDIFKLFPDIRIIIAATIRNQTTFETFLEACKRNNYDVEQIQHETPEAKFQEGPFFSDKVPIRLSRISKA